MPQRFRRFAAPALFLFASAAPAIAWAQDAESPADKIARLERQIAQQQTALDQQKKDLDSLRAALTPEALNVARGGAEPTGAAAGSPILIAQVTPPPSPDTQTVGAPPPEQKVEIASLPENTGVLTPRGHWVLEPSVDYTHGSTNRLVFRGVEIVTGIQVGVIDASDADRNATTAAITGRYGLTDRLEVELRLPYSYRADRITTLVQQQQMATQTEALTGADIGDVEFTARYQLNNGRNGWPIFIANLRTKSDTGSSPYDIPRDQFGVSTKLNTGSGFWAVEPSLTFLYPTDPAVIFASLGYLYDVPSDIDKDIGGVHIGRVKPGDSISASAGFGFALNPRFSFSLGYKHSYIFPTKSDLDGVPQKSLSLQVGAMTFGWSFRLTDRMTISNTYEVGTTRDAPDMAVSFRLPIRF